MPEAKTAEQLYDPQEILNVNVGVLGKDINRCPLWRPFCSYFCRKISLFNDWIFVSVFLNKGHVDSGKIIDLKCTLVTRRSKT